jgi:hypothetical protein
MPNGQRKVSRGFLTAAVAALAVPAVAVLWLGWLLLQQDRELDRQRVEERLNGAAILAVTALEQAIAATEQRLAAVADGADPRQAADAAVASSPPSCCRSGSSSSSAAT